MEYYSTNGQCGNTSLCEAVTRGLAPDKGLYMPATIKKLPQSFFDNIASLSFQEIAFEVAKAFFGEDIPEADLKEIVYDTLSFPCPVVEVEPGVYALELFHGPTCAFKDVGARFMARMLRHFLGGRQDGRNVNVLVATSGDTGSAVANGFLGVEGINVYVLYPKGKVSPTQECQFTTLGRNITALEVDGVFDDCQRLVKEAFMDPELTAKLILTSANSINVARFLPQAFYYFNAYAQLKRLGVDRDPVVCVPSGNFGNITAGIIAKLMGLPISRFIAAGNVNDTVLKCLESGIYTPQPSVATLANAMDVGDPSNFARILDIFGSDVSLVAKEMTPTRITDAEIRHTIAECREKTGYVLDPHGAVGYVSLKRSLRDGEVGVFLETAHPAKFAETVEPCIGAPVEMPERLAAFARGTKQSLPMAPSFTDFKQFLLTYAR